MKYHDVSIVMISRNEEKSVEKVICDIKKYVPGAEIIIVDSSTDKTPIIAKKNKAKVIRQFPPKGYGPAMELALLTPKNINIVTLDCDNTYPINMIPLLISKIKQGYDVVGTSRISLGKPKYMPWINYIANKLFNYFASIIFFTVIQDVQTGMRAYKRELLHKIRWGPKGYVLPGLNKIKSGIRGNSFPVELLLKPVSLGYKFTEVPIAYNQRLGKSKLEKFDSALWTFLRIINSRWYK